VTSTIDVKRLERRLTAAARREKGVAAIELEVRDSVVELAIVLNVIELSPMERVVRGSIAHSRARAALTRLEAKLLDLELASLDAAA
jgi:hypothetical protein